MTRHVKVELEAQVAPYIAGVKAAARATDELGDELAELGLKGEALDVVAAKADKAGDELDDMKTESDRLGESLKGTGVDAGLASEGIEDVGESARTAARQVEKLDREIDAARAELRGLAADFVDADEKSRVDLTKGITALEAKLRGLRKNRDFLKELIPAADPGPEPELDPVDPIKKIVGPRLKTLAISIGAALATPLLPILGAAVAGAVVGGVGVGGIVGGVALAAQNPEIKKRGADVGKAFYAGLKVQADEAFANPLMGALDQLESAGNAILPKLGTFFDNVAPGLDHLVGSLIDAGDAIIDSFVTASGTAEEPMRALGDLIVTTAESIGDLITDLSEYSDEGASGLDDLADTIAFTVGTISGLVTGLAELYGWLDKIATGFDLASGDQVSDGWSGAAASAGALAIASADLSVVTQVLAEDEEHLSEQQSAAARAAHGHRDALVELSDEMRAEADPVFALMKAQEDLAKASKKSAEATAKHGEDSAEAQAALRDLATAAIDLEGKAGALGETFDGRLSAGLRATLRSAGLTKTEIDRLERQFLEAKGAAEGFSKNYRANVSIAGLVKGTSDVRELRRQVEQLRSKTINVRVRVSQQGEILYGGQVGAYAEGGAIEGPGSGTSDDVPIMASSGEHMWTAAEVRAAGGHQAMEQMRAAVLAGGRTSTTQLMPAAAAQRVVVEVTGGIDLSRADATAFGQLLLSTVRTKSAIRQELKTLVNQP